MLLKPRTRLWTRILVWSFIPTSIILTAVALTIYYAYQRVTEDLVVGRNQQLAHLSAAQLSANLGTYVDALKALARNPEVYDGGPDRQAAALQAAAAQLQAFDGGAVTLDPHGKVATAWPAPETWTGEDWSNRSLFRQIIRGASATYSDVVPPDRDHPAVVVVAVPILNPRGELRGTLAGMFQVGVEKTSTFYGGIVKLRLGQSGSTYLVDGTGRVIYHLDASMIGQDVHSRADVAEVLQGRAGYLHMRTADGADTLATFAPVPGTPWGLVNEENWASLLASSRGYGQFLALLLIMGIVLPGLVVFIGVRRITRPLAQLTAAAGEIAGGKYGQQIEVRTGDELEVLGRQFNQMSTQLQQSYTQLEERVQARTKELATLNATAAIASRSLDLHEILDDALEKTLEVLGMEAGGAYALEGPALVLMAYRSRSEEFVRRANRRPFRDSVVEQAALAAAPLVWGIDDFPETYLRPLLESEGMAQIVCVPLMAKRKLVGAFTLGTHQAREVSPEELSLLAAIGQQIGVAVENAHLYEQAEETVAAAERTRLARELHDAVTQTLFSASLIAEVLPDLWQMNEKEGQRRLEELRQLTRGALAEMRTLLVELRPNALVQIPLPDLVRQLCESLVGRARVPIEVSVEGDRRLPPDVQVAFYRITQEALNNVVKHSEATQAAVSLRLRDTVRLTIVDDGCGFEPNEVTAEHLGLKIMRERATPSAPAFPLAASPPQARR